MKYNWTCIEQSLIDGPKVNERWAGYLTEGSSQVGVIMAIILHCVLMNDYFVSCRKNKNMSPTFLQTPSRNSL